MRHSVTGAISAYYLVTLGYRDYSLRKEDFSFSNKKINIYRDKEFLHSHATEIYKHELIVTVADPIVG